MGSNQDTEAIRASALPASTGFRDRIPVLGLQEYWYPALRANRVGHKRPSVLKITGKSVVFFRDAAGEVVAIAQACPHRGAQMSHGVSHFKGTLTCPYHGWTFDGTGQCVAVLGEGPGSTIPGAKGTRARTFATRTLKGIVFVWMGDGVPVPIEEDVPPEMFGDDFLVMNGERTWNANWRPSLENFADAHVYYAHRNSIEMLTQPPPALMALAHSGPARPDVVRINDRAIAFDPNAATLLNYTDRAAEQQTQPSSAKPLDRREFQDTYPSLGGQKWPPTATRQYVSQVCGAVRSMFKPAPAMYPPASEWGMGMHLPSTIRVDYRRVMFTRFEVPIDENRTNNFYFIAVRKGSELNQLLWRAYFHLYYRWKTVSNFSGQDGHLAEITDYAAPERQSTTDRFLREWRRFVVDCARKPGPPDPTKA